MGANSTQFPASGRTVLVVEDSAVQRAHAVELVTQLGGARVLEAANGLEGLNRLAEVPAIDLVLTDLEMPKMDGIHFIGEFAARGFQPELIVISSQEAAVLHSVRLMAETYGLRVPGVISKPLDAERLQKVLLSPSGPPPKTLDPAFGSTRATLTLLEIAKGIRDSEFICFFQPQVTLQGALLKGVEALVRWRHPVYGLLGPAAFLPQTETEERVMADLTMAILAQVAEHWHAWRRRGLTLDVSVNLSAVSISGPGFADHLMAATERLELPAKSVVFELTESASVSNLGHTLANLARLRMRGFRLSIDDFGTGFATFQQLERIPFTELKVDRTIVMHLPQSSRHGIVARNLLQMAQELKLSTVAEGIENLEAWNTLRDLGCESGQGYLIARPMAGDQLIDWAKQDRAWLRK